MKALIRKLFAAPTTPARKPAPLGLTALEARENPSAGVGGWLAELVVPGARPGDLVVSGERYVEVDRRGTDVVRVTMTSGVVEVPTSRLRADYKVVVRGTEGADYIDNYTDRPLLADARGGDDLVYGWSGNDTIRGGAGHDRINGSDGNDLLFGDDGNDTLQGWDGDDTLHGGSGQDRLEGNDGHDRLFGEQDDDRLFGDGWYDAAGRMYNAGRPGRDILDGGAGWDTFVGGAGRDVFFGSRDPEFVIRKWFRGVYSETRYADVIVDLNAWEGDWRA